MNEMREFSRNNTSSLETPIDHGVEVHELRFEPLSPANAEEAEKLVDDIFSYEKGGAGIHILVKSGVVEIVAPEKAGKDYNEHYWVVRDAGNNIIGITGFNEVSGDNPEHCWLGWIGLHKDLRGKGIGASLLEKVVSETKSLGKKVLYIVTTNLPEMQGNKIFYEENGCEIVAVIEKSTIKILKNTGLSATIMKEIQNDHQALFEETEKGKETEEAPELKVFIWKKDLTLEAETGKAKQRETEKTL